MTEAGRVQRTNGEVETSSTNEWIWFINERVNERVGYFFEKSTTFFYTPFVHNHTPFAVQVFDTDYKLLVPVTELSDGAGATSCFLLRPQKSICPLDPLSCFKTKLYRFLASSGANINFTPVAVRLYTSHTVTKEYRERLVGPAELSSDSDERFSLSLWFRKTEESRPKQPPLLCGPSQRTRSRFLRPLNCGAKGG